MNRDILWLVVINIVFVISSCENNQYSRISFPICSSELFRDLPNHEPDYTTGI